VFESYVLITLIDDVVLSNSSSTAGLHESFDYIPGSRLLGIAATKVDFKKPKDAFRNIRSGKVRFGNAYPTQDGKTQSLPVPRSLHEAKFEDTFKDLSFTERTPEDGQAVQQRGGFLSGSTRLQTKKNYVLKSAQDASRGVAKTASLFGYEKLLRGQRFIARISADIEDDLACAMESICGLKYLGRAKSAEFGRIEIEEIDVTESKFKFQDNETEGVSLLCASDLYLFDESGQPRLTPKPSDFGLENAEYDPSRSFLWFKDVTPFNQFHGTYLTTRRAIGLGSVIRIKSQNGPISWRDGTFGAYRELGSGCMVRIPDLSKNITSTNGIVVSTVRIAVKSEEDSSFVQLLKDRRLDSENASRALQLLNEDGSGETNPVHDLMVLRDWDGLPAIPGTSLAGVLRSAYGLRGE